MKKKTARSIAEDDLLLDLAHHNVKPSLLIEFSEKIVIPCFGGNLSAAVSELFQKALSEQDFVLSHINPTRVREVSQLQIQN